MDPATPAPTEETPSATETAAFPDTLVSIGTRRYYVEDLTRRDYALEYTTPHTLDLLGHTIEEHAWGDLLCKTADLLIETFPEAAVCLTELRGFWTKAAMVSAAPKTNYKPLANGLYLNCNHTALHACWLLQDLLDHFGVDKAQVRLLIHHAPAAEPKAVRERVYAETKRAYIAYLTQTLGKSEESAAKAIRRIEKALDPLLGTLTKSYNKLFLFDSNTMLASYLSKLRDRIRFDPKLDPRKKKVLCDDLECLRAFYKQH